MALKTLNDGLLSSGHSSGVLLLGEGDPPEPHAAQTPSPLLLGKAEQE